MFFLFVFLLSYKFLFPIDNLTLSVDNMVRDILFNNPFSKERKYVSEEKEPVISKVSKRSPKRYKQIRIIGIVKIDGSSFVAIPGEDKIVLLKEGEKYNGIVIKQIFKDKVIIEDETNRVEKEIMLNTNS